MLHHTNEVVTVAEAAESVEMTKTAVDEVLHERMPWRTDAMEKKEAVRKQFFSTMNTKVKQANKYGEQ